VGATYRGAFFELIREKGWAGAATPGGQICLFYEKVTILPVGLCPLPLISFRFETT
jgi:hypothetical protein